MPQPPPDSTYTTTLSPTELADPEAAPAAAVDATVAVPTKPRKAGLGFGPWLAIGWLVFVVLIVVLAPILPIPNYSNFYPEIANVGPFHNASHILGGDQNGHDMVSQLVYGTRSSLAVGVGAILVGMIIGGFFGLLAGYYRNWFDNIVSACFDILLAFPYLVLALALAAFLQGDPAHPQGFHLPNLAVLIIALGIVAIPGLGRIARASTLTWSQREFVLAAKAQGAKTRRIIFREVLPNILPAMVSLALLVIALAVIAEGVLSLLGAGVRPPVPSLGNIISINQSALSTGQPYIVFEPVIVMFLVVYALNYLGDVIRTRFDVREAAL